MGDTTDTVLSGTIIFAISFCGLILVVRTMRAYWWPQNIPDYENIGEDSLPTH
jgi:hypothetical protein